MNKKIVKISLYNKNSTPSQVMQGNGDVILDNICISCETEESLITGEYYLDATFLVDKKGLWKNIEEESILKVQMDYGVEIFRIAKIQSSDRYMVVFARQETMYQTLHMWLDDVRPENRDGLSALNHIKENCIGKKNVTFVSDISELSTAYYMDMNVYEALHTCNQSFLNRWGGEVQRRGYTLTINNKLGTHRGVQIRSRKNLTGFEANVDMDNVFTRIKPKGYDGITIDGFIDSPLINNYPDIKTTTIEYGDVKVKDPDREDDEGFETLAEAQEELKRRVNLEFSQNNIDKIRADYTINFIQLEQTEEYKNYVQAERVYLGDEIDVYEENLDIDLTVRAITRKYDVVNQKVLEVGLSNNPIKINIPTIGDLVNKIENIETDIIDNNNWYQDAIDNATDLIQNGLKNSYVIVRKNEILIMDTTDINTATKVWRWTNGGFGYSNTGYYGTYETAITMDGSIVGKFITGLVVNGNQINAKNLNVYNTSGIKTLEVTSGGDVNLNVNSLRIVGKDVATQEYINNQIEQDRQNLRCGNIGMKLNYSDFNTSSGGSIYFHGYDENGNPADINGSIYWNGVSQEITKRKLSPSTTYYRDCYICVAPNSSTLFVAYRSGDVWKKRNMGSIASATDLSLYDTTITLGQFKLNSNATDIEYAFMYSSPMKLENVAGVASVESRLSTAELKITSDAIVSTVTNSSTYKNDINGLDSRLNSAEQKITADAIINTVSSSYYKKDETDGKYLTSSSSTITQMANQISSKVSSSDLSTIVKQNATSWGLSINGKLSGTNYNFDGTNFSIGTTSGSDKAYHSATYSRWNHSDGSYTQASSGGLVRYSSGTGRSYHYLMHSGTVQSSGSVVVPLPSHISGKVGTNYTVSISARGYGFNDWVSTALQQLYMVVKNKTSTSFTIETDLYGLKVNSNTQTIGGWVNVDYTIIA